MEVACLPLFRLSRTKEGSYNNTMMEPSLDELLEKVNNRYVLVVAAAKRARRLEANSDDAADRSDNDNALSTLDLFDKDKGEKGDKPITRALKEIANDTVKIYMEETKVENVKAD